MKRHRETAAEARTSIARGARGLATRQLAAEEAFVEHVMSRGRLSRGEAERVLAAFRKARVIKLDAVNGTWHVKHGAFLDVDVLHRAAGRG